MSRRTKILVISRRLLIFAALSVAFTLVLFGVTFLYGKRFFMSFFAFECGIVGGFVSIQQRLKKIGDEELALLSESWATILVAPIYGGIFSLILYMLFLSGLVKGHLFPEFSIQSFGDPVTTQDIRNFFTQTYPTSPSDFAKFGFWSFVAGFSERFVPQLVRKVTPNQ